MSFWKKYFYFTRKERNGILFLLVLIIFSWFFYLSIKYWFYRNESDFQYFERAVKNFYESFEKKSANELLKNSVLVNKDTCKVLINWPKYEHLLCLGLNEKLSRTWMNYILKGGKFKSIEDVKRLWGMNDSIFQHIKDFLLLEENKSNINKEISEKTDKCVKTIQMLELNTSDTNQLKDLPGIGSSYARRIIKYKERLGGYINKEQLKEIYGFNNELYEKVAPYIYVDIFEVKKLNINTSDYTTLIQHPYFNKEMVKSIIQLRKKLGKLYSKDDLFNHQIITPEDWDRIKWYVEF